MAAVHLGHTPWAQKEEEEVLSQNSSYATVENHGKIVMQISYFFFFSSKTFPHLNMVHISSRLASLVLFLSVWSCVSFILIS